MEIDFSGKVAFVTGAAGGIGLAVARMFAESGAKVAMTDIDDARLKQSAEDLKSKGFDILPIVCDISDEAQTKEAVERAARHFGRIDAAYNNVGIHAAVRERLADTDGEDFDHVIAVNLRGVWNAMKYELIRNGENGKRCNRQLFFSGRTCRNSLHRRIQRLQIEQSPDHMARVIDAIPL